MLAPRRVGRQIYRENVDTQDVQSYYRITTGRAILDHVMQDVKQRFGPEQQKVAKLLLLSPKKLLTTNPKQTIEELEGALTSLELGVNCGQLKIEIPILVHHLKSKVTLLLYTC